VADSAQLDLTFTRRGAARFSDDLLYRYTLERQLLGGTRRRVNFIGLNPSTADGSFDDPTIRRCIGFARRGFDHLVMTNLFAWRSTDPAGLWDADDPIGPTNDRHLVHQAVAADLVVAVWGSSVRSLSRDRVTDVMAILPWRIHCLGVTRDRMPRHPLYLASDTSLELYRDA